MPSLPPLLEAVYLSSRLKETKRESIAADFPMGPRVSFHSQEGSNTFVSYIDIL